jgi:hypothetical protein
LLHKSSSPAFVHPKQAWVQYWILDSSISLSDQVQACRTAHVCYILVCLPTLAGFHQAAVAPCASKVMCVLV